MRKQIFIKLIISFFALLLVGKAGMATAIYSERAVAETICFIQSSSDFEQNGIVEPVLQLQNPAASGRLLKLAHSGISSIKTDSFSIRKFNSTYFLNYYHFYLFKGITLYLFNCVFLI
jgi:hypothetical protein